MNSLKAAEIFLRTLKELGCDYLFTIPGPETALFASIFGRIPADELPKPMVVPSEALAVSMAHGYFLATGRPQAVLAHFDTGVASSLVHLIGAAKMNTPLLFISSRTPVTEGELPGARDRSAHWVHDSFDPTGAMREFIKWDFEVSRASTIREVLGRAWEVLFSSPCGPVSLSISREVLLESVAVDGSPVQSQKISPMEPSPASVELLRKNLEVCSRPLILTSRSGLNPQNVDLLEKVAERYQVGVLCPLAQTVNMRTSHPCFLGFGEERVLKEADFILVLDCDVPWIPHRQSPSSTARIFHVGPDPLFQSMPLRNFRSDYNLQAGVEETLLALLAKAPPDRERSAWVTSHREAWTVSRLEAPLAKFNPSAVAEILSLSLSKEVVLINESSLPTEFLQLEHPGTYVRTGSILGWSMGCALGFKLGRPQSLPMAVVGDGAFYLSQPLAAIWVSQNRGLPILTVVLNDSGQASNSTKPFSSLSPGLPIAKIAEAAGASAAAVQTRPELKAAVEQALSRVKEGSMALIEARL